MYLHKYMDVSKNRGKTPQMDGENNGKPYEQMDDLGGFPIFLVQHPYVTYPHAWNPYNRYINPPTIGLMTIPSPMIWK